MAARDALVRAWNLLGLLDLAVPVTLAFLSSPSPFQMLSLDDPNELISVYPLVMVPVFAVPLAVILHLASLVKIARTTTSDLRKPAHCHATQLGQISHPIEYRSICT